MNTQNTYSSRRNQVPSQSLQEKVDLKALTQQANTIIYQSLIDENPLLRTHAIEVLTELKKTDYMATVIKHLRDEEVPVRFAAAVAIGDLNYHGGALPVKRLLDDENVSVRTAAAYALTKLGREDHFEMITQNLKSSDQVARANAALLLGKLGDKKAAKPLLWALNAETSTNLVRIQSVVAIAMVGVDKGMTYQRLWALLISNMADNKIMGLQGMRYLGTDDAENALEAILVVDDDQTRLYPEIRLYAAQQLAKMGNKSGKDYIMDYFNQIRPLLSRGDAERADSIAAPAIGHIGDMELAKYLPKMIRSNNKVLRLRAAEAVLLLNQN